MKDKSDVIVGRIYRIRTVTMGIAPDLCQKDSVVTLVMGDYVKVVRVDEYGYVHLIYAKGNEGITPLISKPFYELLREGRLIVTSLDRMEVENAN